MGVEVGLLGDGTPFGVEEDEGGESVGVGQEKDSKKSGTVIKEKRGRVREISRLTVG